MALTFPHVGGLTDADNIIVRGTASSTVGVLNVSVAGVAAASQDAFAHWQVSVPLALGPNELEAVATDTLGTSAAAPSVIVERSGAIPVAPYGMAYDGAASKVYVSDFPRDALLVYDETTKQSHVVSSPAVCSGASIGAPYDVAIDVPGDRAFLSQVGTASVLTVSLVTPAE